MSTSAVLESLPVKLVVRNTFLEVEEVEQEVACQRKTHRRSTTEAIFFRKSTTSIETGIDSDSDPESDSSELIQSCFADAIGSTCAVRVVNCNEERVEHRASICINHNQVTTTVDSRGL
jgi:hypothetical protein